MASSEIRYVKDDEPQTEPTPLPKPLYDRILVERGESETKIGRFVLPDTAQEKANYGTILKVGDGRKIEGSHQLAPMQVRAGDRVVFGKYAGVEVQHEGKTWIYMREEDVLAVL